MNKRKFVAKITTGRRKNMVYCWNGDFLPKEEHMKKIRGDVRVTVADTVSDVLVRLYKEAAKDGAVVKDAALATIMGEVETRSAQITTAIKSGKPSASLEDADSKRDGIISSLFTLLAGYGAIPVAKKKAAAERLLAVTGKYKGIANEAYARESSLVESMLEDLAAESLSDSVKLLEGVGDLIASLRSAQDEFNAANDSATAALTAKGESATALKKPLLSVVNEKLVPYITAMGALNAEYAEFGAKADVEIAKANASVK